MGTSTCLSGKRNWGVTKINKLQASWAKEKTKNDMLKIDLAELVLSDG